MVIDKLLLKNRLSEWKLLVINLSIREWVSWTIDELENPALDQDTQATQEPNWLTYCNQASEYTL